MLYGRLTDLALRCKGANFDPAFSYLSRLEDTASEEHKKLLSLNPGEVQKIEIKGKQVFAILQCYDSKARSAVRLEAHRKYADIQYVLSGKEVMSLDISAGLKPVEPYNAEKDLEFLQAESPVDLPLSAGIAAVLFPEDAHAPGIAAAGSERVYKCVMKVELGS